MTLYDSIKFVGQYLGNKAKASFRQFNRRGRHAYDGAGFGQDLKQWYTDLFANADSEILEDLPELRRRSRDVSRNNAIGRGALSVLENNVIGTGLKLQSRINAAMLGITDDQARAWEENVEARFRAWCETSLCDIERERNFYDLQRIAYGNKNASGDSFTILRVNSIEGQLRLQLSLVEADQVRSPQGTFQNMPSGVEIRDGVELSPVGRRLAYWICPKTIFDNPVRFSAYGEESSRKNIIHLFTKERIGQTRGVPILAPVIKKIKNLDRYAEAELKAAVVSSFISLFIKTDKKGPLKTPLDKIKRSTAPQKGDVPGLDSLDFTLAPGMVKQLRDGESIEDFNPSRPNSNYEAFVNQVIREIGMGIGVPYEILRMHFEASFSASRGSKVEFVKKLLIERDTIMAQHYCQPIYLEWLWLEVLTGRISAPGFEKSHESRYAWSRSKWVGDSPGHIDPLKEVMAAKLRVDEGFSTRESESLQLTGSSYLENAARLKAENQEKAAADAPLLNNEKMLDEALRNEE